MKPEAKPDIADLGQYDGQPVPWIWPPFLPCGMLAMLSGDPGVGKTYVALAMAAALTAGRIPGTNGPEGAGVAPPVDVLYMSMENNPAHILRPRFDLLHGNPKRFHLLNGKLITSREGASYSRVKLTDLDILGKAIRQTEAGLVIVDPLQSYFDAELNRAQKTRPLMDALARLARVNSCCILLIRHLSKARTGRAVARGFGSIDLSCAVRSEMLAGCAFDGSGERAMVHVKSNISPLGPAMGYTIDPNGGFRWTGETALTAPALLAPEPALLEPGSARELAEQFLRRQLVICDFPVERIKQNALVEGISERTLERAKARLGVIARRQGGHWYWKLQEKQQLVASSQESVVRP